MSNKQDTVLRLLKNVAKADPDIAIMWIYGSRAKGTAHENSDYDVAVAFNNFGLSEESAYLRPNLLQLDLINKLNVGSNDISVIDIDRAPPYLAFNIIETGQLLHKDDTDRYYLLCNKVWSKLSYLEKENQREQLYR